MTDYEELVINSLRNLRREGMRTFLTLIGIIIGVASIVALISIGAGLNVAVTKQFEQLGSNTIIIFPGNPTSQQGTTTIQLSQEDIDHIENIAGVDEAVEIYATQATMEFNNQKKSVLVLASDFTKTKIFDETGLFDIDEGSRPERNSADAALIGNKIAVDYFDKPVELRKIFLINGEEFKAAGILQPQQQALGDPESGNTMIFISTEGFKRISTTLSPLEVIAKTDSVEDNAKVSEDIQKYFDDKYGKKSVFVSSSDQLLSLINQIYGLITIVLTGIAAISLIVGGIGIANAMVASVIERTKEIGLMKAIGASDNKILLIFLLEAAFIGAIGGIIGILLGAGISALIAFIGQAAGFAFESVITPELVVGALFFSMFVGMVSGFLPARKAAALDPVDSLRYE